MDAACRSSSRLEKRRYLLNPVHLRIADGNEHAGRKNEPERRGRKVVAVPRRYQRHANANQALAAEQAAGVFDFAQFASRGHVDFEFFRYLEAFVFGGL